MMVAPPITTASRGLAFMTILAFAILAWFVARDGNPADLRASWLAADFFAQGRSDLIYPGSSGSFLMQPPAEWADAALRHGYSGELYPYIYPPLWAALLALLVPHAGFDSFAGIASLLNPLLLALTPWLAWRATASTLTLSRWMAIAAVALFPTTYGAHALLQQQPQIFAAFLIVLAIERDRAGAPVTAGLSLALAAALKVYPALFVLFWLVQGRHRAVLSFACAGAGLGLLSVTLAGWPLHVAFLSELSRISATVLVNGLAYNLDATLAHLLHRDILQPIVALHAGPAPEGAGGVFILAKGTLWQNADRMVLVLVLAVMAIAFRRLRGDVAATARLWPLALMVVALVSPMAFAYHYLPAVVFVPLIVDRRGPRIGILLVTVGILPAMIVVQALLPPSSSTLFASQLLGILSVALLVAGFALSATRNVPHTSSAHSIRHRLREAEG